MPAAIRIAITDPELRAYLADCLNAMSDVHLVGSNAARADLVVTDGTGGGGAGEPALYVCDEPPRHATDFVVMPFDAATFRVAVRRALQRPRRR